MVPGRFQGCHFAQEGIDMTRKGAKAKARPELARDAGNFSDNRYTQRTGETAPPPDVAAAAAAPRSSGGFVRGGTLGTVAQGIAAHSPSICTLSSAAEPEFLLDDRLLR